MIIQKTKPFNFFELGFEEKIKGRTRIELHDVKTRAKKVFESENTFYASHIAAYMRNLGVSGNTPYQVPGGGFSWASVPEMWKKYVGGILLFKNAIPDNSLMMPAGNKMTANGVTGITNNGDPAEFGTWNASESAIGTSSMVFVYDWNTSQGNGDIASVCLTSDSGGYLGYGNASGNSKTNDSGTWGARRAQNAMNLGTTERHMYYKNWLYYINTIDESASDYVYDKTNATITFTKTHCPVTQGSIFDGRGETATISISGSLSGFPNTNHINAWAYDGNGHLVLLPYPDATYSVASGGTIYYILVDLEAGTATAKAITNKTNTDLAVRTGSYPGLSYDGENLIMSKTSSYGRGTDEIYIIDGDNGDVVYEYKPHETASGDYAPHVFKLSSGLYIVTNGRTSYGPSIMLDTVNETAYKLNSTSRGLTDSSTGERISYDAAENLLLNHTSTGERIFNNPLFLATINNQGETITKQNTNTMKVTYTLSQA